MRLSVQRFRFTLSVLVLWLLAVTPSGVSAGTPGGVAPTEIFPPVQEHVHGSTIVELPNGDLLAAWFQGSGERWADDVRIMGTRLKKGEDQWSKPFLMADTPGFPDINPILFLDAQKRLWLMWYTVIANQWETSLLKYRISEDYAPRGMGFQPMNHRQDADATKVRRQDARGTEKQGQDALATGAPQWAWQDVLHVKPGDSAERGIQPNDRFVKSVQRQIEEYGTYIKEGLYAGQPAQGVITAGLWKAWGARMLSKARGEDLVRKGQLQNPAGPSKETDLGYPYFQRMGWQTKNKAVLVEGQRLIVPLYSDGFSFSLMAFTDDGGQTWRFSEPLVGAGNIQPSIASTGGRDPRRLHARQRPRAETAAHQRLQGQRADLEPGPRFRVAEPRLGSRYRHAPQRPLGPGVQRYGARPGESGRFPFHRRGQDMVSYASFGERLFREILALRRLSLDHPGRRRQSSRGV